MKASLDAGFHRHDENGAFHQLFIFNRVEWAERNDTHHSDRWVRRYAP
jgi:hypothetical protein